MLTPCQVGWNCFRLEGSPFGSNFTAQEKFKTCDISLKGWGRGSLKLSGQWSPPTKLANFSCIWSP